jgi:hypothetical protein
VSQLTKSTAREHGAITIFIDSGPPIQYAPDRAWRRLGAR